MDELGGQLVAHVLGRRRIAPVLRRLLALDELGGLQLVGRILRGLLVLPGGLLLRGRDVLRRLLLLPGPRLGGLPLRVPRVAGGGDLLLRSRISVGAVVGSPGFASHGPLVLHLRLAHCQSVSDAF